MQKKKIKYISLIIICLVIVIGCVFLKDYDNKIVMSSSKAIQLSDEDLFIDMSRDDLNQKISDKESFFVYIGRPTCPDCKKFMPNLKDILKDLNLQIFYYNSDVPASKKQEERDYLRSFNISSIPCILSFKDGQEVQLYDCQDTDQVQNFINDFKGGN